MRPPCSQPVIGETKDMSKSCGGGSGGSGYGGRARGTTAAAAQHSLLTPRWVTKTTGRFLAIHDCGLQLAIQRAAEIAREPGRTASHGCCGWRADNKCEQCHRYHALDVGGEEEAGGLPQQLLAASQYEVQQLYSPPPLFTRFFACTCAHASRLSELQEQANVALHDLGP